MIWIDPVFMGLIKLILDSDPLVFSGGSALIVCFHPDLVFLKAHAPPAGYGIFCHNSSCLNMVRFFVFPYS
jgi:hypothetical protein